MPFTMPIMQQCQMCIWCFDGMFFEIWWTLSTILCCIFGIVQLHLWHCTLSIIIIFLDHHIHLHHKHHSHYRHFHHHYHHNFKQKLNFHCIILLSNTIIIIPPITISSSSLPSSSSTPLWQLSSLSVWLQHLVWLQVTARTDQMLATTYNFIQTNWQRCFIDNLH